MTLRRDGKPAHWNDETLHRAGFASDPELYSLMAFTVGVQPWQQARILFVLLAESRLNLSLSLRTHYERITLFLLATLPTDFVLTVFLAVRRARANHRHTVRATLSYLLQHPDIETLARSRPRAIRDCLEHAVGKSRARYFGCHSPRSGQEASLPAPLRRSGGSEAKIRRLADLLYFGQTEQKVRQEGLTEVASEKKMARSEILAPVLRQLYRDGTSPELIRRLEAAIASRSDDLPELPGRIALMLDASASMRGSGEQEYAPIALAVAFERVLQAKCTGLRSYTIGGFGWPPAPEGPTDFGRLLLDALEGEPELIVLLTDGYENLNQGDAARIVSTLRKLGLSIPVVCCRIESHDRRPVSYARPSEALPSFPLGEEGDFGAILQILDMTIAPQAARERLVNRLRERQKARETEVYGWTVAP